MTINLKGNQLVITFKFDPQVIAAVRTIPGRKFNVDRKHWEVPIENVIECVDTLAPFGLTPTLDVKAVYNSQRQQVRMIEDVKSEQIPFTTNLPLFPFQKIGAGFLRTVPAGLLADEPGLGKTIQTIAAVEGDCAKIVFCPSSLKYTWAEEIHKWRPDAAVVVVDGDKETRKKQWQGLAPWMIANYELLLHDHEEILGHEFKYGPADVIVCDEATRISNPAAKTTKILKTLKAKKKIALTGTPISNSPNDIYSIIDWLAPRYFGSYYQFLEKYCIREPRFNRIVGYQNLPDLNSRISRFMLRRTKNEVLTDLPPKIIEDIPFEISKKERKLYDDIRKLIISELQGLKDVDLHTLNLIPVKMLRLKQVTDHPALITGKNSECSKLETLKELLKPIVASGEKFLVFTQFAEMAKILLGELNLYCPRMIIGDMNSESRFKAIQEFNTDLTCQGMIMTEAGAYGLNLQAASYVIHYDAPWSISKLMQREDRAHRMGQTKPVTVYNLIAKNTIDEYVAKTLHKKQKVSVDILGDEERLEELGWSEEDIKAILRI